MPEVIIKARSDWYPSDYQPDSPHKSLRLSPKQELTVDIGMLLPAVIVEAFQFILGEKLKLGEVVYDFERYNHYCSGNQPDIGITLSPKWTAEREAKMVELRDYIRNEVHKFLSFNRKATIRSDGYPVIDLMIKFVIETGVAINQHSEITSTW